VQCLLTKCNRQGGGGEEGCTIKSIENRLIIVMHYTLTPIGLFLVSHLHLHH
jgi:hypothetical protein